MQSQHTLNLRLPGDHVMIPVPAGRVVTGLAVSAREIGQSVWTDGRVQVRWSAGPFPGHPSTAYTFLTAITLSPAAPSASVPSRELEGIGAGCIYLVVSTAEAAGTTTAMVEVRVAITLDGPVIQPTSIDGGGA